MGSPGEPYFKLLVESFYSGSVSGKHGPVHMRPVYGQGVSAGLYVESAKEMRDLSRFPIHSQFLVWAKYSDREGGVTFLKAPYRWGYTSVDESQAKSFLERCR